MSKNLVFPLYNAREKTSDILHKIAGIAIFMGGVGLFGVEAIALLSVLPIAKTLLHNSTKVLSAI